MNFSKVFFGLSFENLASKTKDSETCTKAYYNFLKDSKASIFLALILLFAKLIDHVNVVEIFEIS